MGAGQSTPEDVLKIVNEPVSYIPPLEVNPTNPVCYFDIQLGRYGDATKLGRITMELKADVTPKTAENFKQLCLADEGNGYKGSRFHRVIPQFMVRHLPRSRDGLIPCRTRTPRRHSVGLIRCREKARAFYFVLDSPDFDANSHQRRAFSAHKKLSRFYPRLASAVPGR